MTRKKEINSPARNCWLTTADGLPWLLTPHRLKSSCNTNVKRSEFGLNICIEKSDWKLY